MPTGEHAPAPLTTGPHAPAAPSAAAEGRAGTPMLTLGVPYGDVLLPVLVPLLVALLETVWWDDVQAYAWLIFLPGVALSAWLCGLTGGLLTLTCSLAFAEGLFLALGDQTGAGPESRAIAAVLFSLLALLPVLLLQRFRSERRALHEALAALRMRALFHTDAQGDDGSDLSLLRRLRTELVARELALAANPFPLALFGEDGRCLYASTDFADQLGLPFEAALALNLLGDDTFPVAGAPAAASQLLQGRSGERSVLTVSDGRRRCQLRLVRNMPSPTIMLSMHQDGQLTYGSVQRPVWARPVNDDALQDDPPASLPPDATAPDAAQPAAAALPTAAAAALPTAAAADAAALPTAAAAAAAAAAASAEAALSAPERALLADLPTQAQQPGWQPVPTSSASLTGLRCLVVDDHQINRQLMSELLALEGVDVTLANNGLQAVSVVNASPGGFDVVLMDLQMPGLDGYGAARQIRATLSADALPIFAVTADGAGVDRVRLHAAGIQDLLHKPIDHAALLQALRSLRSAGNAH